MRIQNLVLLCAVLIVWMPAFVRAQPVSVEPITVCEAVKNLQKLAGKPFGIVGRLSFRSEGKWLSQDDCKGAPGNGEARITLLYDTAEAPRVKTGWEVRGSAMSEKLTLLRKATKLALFPFGTPDYDRWAVVYGSLRFREGTASGDAAAAKKAEADLLYAGDGYVLIIK